MAIETQFEIVLGDATQHTIINELRMEYEDAYYAVDAYGESTGSSWPNMLEDIVKFSTKHPNSVFTVIENRGHVDAIFYIFIKNGQIYEDHVTVTPSLITEYKLMSLDDYYNKAKVLQERIEKLKETYVEDPYEYEDILEPVQ